MEKLDIDSGYEPVTPSGKKPCLSISAFITLFLFAGATTLCWVFQNRNSAMKPFLITLPRYFDWVWVGVQVLVLLILLWLIFQNFWGTGTHVAMMCACVFYALSIVFKDISFVLTLYFLSGSSILLCLFLLSVWMLQTRDVFNNRLQFEIFNNVISLFLGWSIVQAAVYSLRLAHFDFGLREDLLKGFIWLFLFGPVIFVLIVACCLSNKKGRGLIGFFLGILGGVAAIILALV